MRTRFLILCLLLSVPAMGQNALRAGRDTIRFDLWDYVVFNGTFGQQAERGRFIFDTGAGSTFLDSAFFARTHHDSVAGDSVIIQGIGNRQQKALFVRDTLHLSLDGVDCISTKTAILNLNEILPGVDGIMGVGVFGDRPYLINYCDQQIVLLNERDVKRLPNEGFEKITLRPSAENFLSLDMTIIFDSSKRKTITTLAHIDTGNPETLDLTPNVALRRQIGELSPGSVSFDIASLGVGGGAQLTLVKCQALQIGNQVVKMSAFGIIENEDQDTTRSSNGILGNEFMVHFDFAVDMEGRSIYLRPNKWFYKVARVNYSGFLVSPTARGYFVNGLSNRKVGVHYNDLITHIDQKSVLDLQWWDLQMFFTTADLKYTLRIERDGQIKEVKIKNLNYKTLWQ